MLAAVGLLLLLLPGGARGTDTLAASVGPHTLSRIAQLLSPWECRRLRARLQGPDEDLEELELELERLSEERNPLGRRQRRALGRPAGCSEALRGWLRVVGEGVTWDRLVRGLRHVGRPDIARELGKNLNQDRSLELQEGMEGYGPGTRRLPASPPGEEGGWHAGTRGRRAPEGQRGDLSFQRLLPPPYSRSLLGWVGPVVSGILGGFLASLLFATAAVCSCRWTLGLDT